MKTSRAVSLALVACFCATIGGARAADPAKRTATVPFETVVIQAPAAANRSIAANATVSEKVSDKSAAAAEPKAKEGRSPPSQAPAPAAGTTPSQGSGPAQGAVPGPAKAVAPPETEWPAVEIELAKARCQQLLKTLDAVTIPEPPFRSGECGAPAPVRLVSLGKNPAVSFSPPALVTCDMVAALYDWVKRDLQPLARRHLGSPIVSIESMSDYSCRKAYGRVANRLSEHGRANALDIRGFRTMAGSAVAVLNDWGPTQRDIAKQIAAAKAAAEKADAIKAEAERIHASRATGATGGATAGPLVPGLPKPTIVDGVPKVTITLPGTYSGAKLPQDAEQLGIAPPTHLGGPKDGVPPEKKPVAQTGKPAKSGNEPTPAKRTPQKAALPTTPPQGTTPPTKTALFLHGAHKAACQIFGTTLGPEANEAHRNHFHVDMAERKFKKICD